MSGDQKSLAELLATTELFAGLKRSELARLACAAETTQVDFGETVYAAGDRGTGLYVVKSGAVRLLADMQGKEVNLGVRRETDVFAEMAALKDCCHETSARAAAKTELALIPRTAIAEVLNRNVAAQRTLACFVSMRSAADYIACLFNLRDKVSDNEIRDLIKNVGVKRVRAERTVLEQDAANDRRLYVVRHGKVRIVRKEAGVEYRLATREPGEVIGEQACLNGQNQPASVIADTDVTLLVLPQDIVQQILARNPQARSVLEQRIRFVERELQRQQQLAQRRSKVIPLDLGSRPELGERIVKRFPLVQQAEQIDCGPACLAMICKHYDIAMTLGKLRELANVSAQGASLDSLARTAESLGFTARGVRCTYQELLTADLPLIVHWEGYHFVVVYGVSKNHVWIADPGAGFRKLTVAQFERGWRGICLMLTPSNVVAQQQSVRSPWVRFAGYLQPHRKILAHLFMATFVIQVLGVAPPLIIQNVLDRVIVHSDVSLLHLLIVGLVITSVFTQLTTVLRGLLANFMVRSLDFAMMSQFCKHTFSLPLSFFAKRKTGDIFARFQENQTIRAFLTESTITTVLNLLMVFIYFTILFIYNVQMTALLVVLVIPLLVLTALATPKIKRYAREAFQASTESEAVLMETLSGAETVKGMGIERLMRLKWEKKYTASLDVQYRAQRFGIYIGLASQLMNSTTTVVMLWVGASLVLAQQLTIGQLIAFNALMGSVMTPLLGLVRLWHQVQAAGVAMERLGDVLEIEPEQKPKELASRIVLPEVQGNIKLDEVYFRYGDSAGPYVLENISFETKPGELVAIVGDSGSGKTTLARLLVGFYKPTEGKITVDGYDMNALNVESYRAQIGYVLQSNLLFSGTIAENIAAGDDCADQRRIANAARLADAHGFISRMPMGYEQVVGERGMGLSGGQVQRLCIARALYRDPRVLIFDEATSALDMRAESNILKNLQDTLHDRTMVVIAHRLSTIMQADRILVLYNGAIVEQGRHEELLARKGMYHQLMHKQIAGA